MLAFADEAGNDIHKESGLYWRWHDSRDNSVTWHSALVGHAGIRNYDVK